MGWQRVHLQTRRTLPGQIADLTTRNEAWRGTQKSEGLSKGVFWVELNVRVISACFYGACIR